jgi:hypothetical protein
VGFHHSPGERFLRGLVYLFVPRHGWDYRGFADFHAWLHPFGVNPGMDGVDAGCEFCDFYQVHHYTEWDMVSVPDGALLFEL